MRNVTVGSGRDASVAAKCPHFNPFSSLCRSRSL